MSIIDDARALRAKIEEAAANLTDAQALAMGAATLFPAFDPAGHAYKTGDRVAHGGVLYRCLQDHKSQADWTPDAAASLWVRVDNPAEEWPAWRQPTGSTDAYPDGAKVSHNGKHWVSNVDANVWEPGAAGITQWTEEK